MQIIFYEQVESTNILALDMARQGAPPKTVVWAGRQSGGRGQYGRSFASPPGGLYFSLLLEPNLPLARLPMVTLAAGVGCARALEQMCGLAVLLKWPNDLVYVRPARSQPDNRGLLPLCCPGMRDGGDGNGKKLGGILTEGVPARQGESQRVVVGVGINVNSRPADFSSRLSTRLTSVYAESGREFVLEPLLESCCRAILEQAALLQHQPDKLLALWDARDYCKGRRLSWESGAELITGTGQGIMADGRYCLESEDGSLHAIQAGRIRPLEEI